MHQRSLEDPNTSGMGTTLTVAAVEDGVVSIGHVGDSRAYLVRDGNLEQLTEDHSLVGELMRTGKLSAEEAESHPQRSMITRALGTDPNVDVDIFSVEPRAGDLFLLCSDGLTSMVDDREILRLVGEKRGDLDDLVEGADQGREQGRRRGQHHGDRVRDRRAASDSDARGHRRRRRADDGARARRRGHADRGRRRADGRHRGRERRRDRGRVRARAGAGARSRDGGGGS